jgi:hypothetical protein
VVAEAALWVVVEGAVVATEQDGAERALDGADVEGVGGVDGIGALVVGVAWLMSKVMTTVGEKLLTRSASTSQARRSDSSLRAMFWFGLRRWRCASACAATA